VPIYDYVCSNCSTRTEFIHGIDAPAPRFCPTCGAEDTLRKVFVPPAVHFKGSGWAKKDRSTASTSKTKASAATGSGDGASSSSSSGEGGATASDGEAGSSKKATDSSSTKSTSTAKSGEG
jgi:putative FmdB family regulatory protein